MPPPGRKWWEQKKKAAVNLVAGADVESNVRHEVRPWKPRTAAVDMAVGFLKKIDNLGVIQSKAVVPPTRLSRGRGGDDVGDFVTQDSCREGKRPPAAAREWPAHPGPSDRGSRRSPGRRRASSARPRNSCWRHSCFQIPQGPLEPCG